MPRIIRVTSAMRRLVVVGLREAMALDSSRTKRRWIAGIFEASVNSLDKDLNLGLDWSGVNERWFRTQCNASSVLGSI